MGLGSLSSSVELHPEVQMVSEVVGSPSQRRGQAKETDVKPALPTCPPPLSACIYEPDVVYVATKHLPGLEVDALHLEWVEGSGKRRKEIDRGCWGCLGWGKVAWAGFNISMQAVKTQ